MPYVNKPRPYKKEYVQQKKRGKDIDHKKALSRGGTNDKKNIRVVKASTNRSFKRNSDRSVKKA